MNSQRGGGGKEEPAFFSWEGGGRGGVSERDVTKHVSVHEYEPAEFTAITVSVTLIQTAL